MSEKIKLFLELEQFAVLRFIEERVTKLSVMPCRLNGDLHEWFNEVVTVPG